MATSEPKGIQVEIGDKKTLIEHDIQAVIDRGKNVGMQFNQIILNRKKVLEWRNCGVKYFQFTDEQINNPSKNKGYIGRRCGLNVYVR